MRSMGGSGEGLWGLRLRGYDRPGECSRSGDGLRPAFGYRRGIRLVGRSCQLRVIERMLALFNHLFQEMNIPQ